MFLLEAFAPFPVTPVIYSLSDAIKLEMYLEKSWNFEFKTGSRRVLKGIWV